MKAREGGRHYLNRYKRDSLKYKIWNNGIAE